jgi:hypothetical protein
MRKSAMTDEPKYGQPDKVEGYDVTRFNALRHGVLSRYTVLPWEDADEYRALVAALVTEHAPQGLTEEHLVEELAGIVWRKRRLRSAGSKGYKCWVRNGRDWQRQLSRISAGRFGGRLHALSKSYQVTIV